MTRRIVLGVGLLLALVAGGWLISRALRPRELGAIVTVRRGRIEATIDALGSLRLTRQFEVLAEVSGAVRSIAVQPGDEVISGTLLIELDSPDLREGLLQAQSALTLRQAELDAALAAPDQTSIDLAVARLRRATVLRQNAQADYDAIAEQPDAESSDEALALEAAKLEYRIAESEYDATMRGASDLDLERLRASLEEAQRAVERGQARMERLRILAPLDGVVLSVDVQVGGVAYANNPVLRIADLRQLEARAEVSELDIAAVAAGQAATLWLDAFPSLQLDGEVTRVLPAPSTARGMTAYEAVITFDGQGLALRPGMGANIRITTGVEEDALLVPRRALRTVGFDQVVRVVEGRSAIDVVVTTGLANGDEVQVLTGLSEGQRVLVD